MFWPTLFRARAERVIVGARTVLAASALLAIWLDPSQPAQHAQATYAILTGYVAYALTLAILTWRTEWPGKWLAAAARGIDLVVFALLMYLTDGLTSPFFVFFTFAMMAAMLRWQWRGVMFTAAAALAVLLGLGIVAGRYLAGADFEIDRFIIRAVYLAVAATMLGYAGAHQEAVRHRLWTLVAWFRAAPGGRDSVIGEILRHVARVFGVRRILMVWSDDEEPWWHVALWDDGNIERDREPPDRFDPPVTEELATSFLCLDAASSHPVAIYGPIDQLRRRPGLPIHPALQERFRIGAVVGLLLPSQSVSGWLFVLDKDAFTTDDLLIGEVVAGQVAARLDQLDLLDRLRLAAAVQERDRVARDLHDSVLQSLTGIALQLQALRGQLESDPSGAGRRLQEVQRALSAEQRNLRRFIEQLKPHGLPWPESDLHFAGRLATLAEQLKGQWGLELTYAVTPADARLPAELVDEVGRIVSEGAANACRHGGATQLEVAADLSAGRLDMTLADNGRGFADAGAGDLHPKSLQERVSALGGILTLEQASVGVRVRVVLPTTPPQAPRWHQPVPNLELHDGTSKMSSRWAQLQTGATVLRQSALEDRHVH